MLLTWPTHQPGGKRRSQSSRVKAKCSSPHCQHPWSFSSLVGSMFSSHSQCSPFLSVTTIIDFSGFVVISSTSSMVSLLSGPFSPPFFRRLVNFINIAEQYIVSSQILKALLAYFITNCSRHFQHPCSSKSTSWLMSVSQSQ